MIKCETIGMLDRVVVDPTIKADNAVKNYSFMQHEGDYYLVANTIAGDDAYAKEYEFPAGEFLNGYLLKSLEGQKLVIDFEHIRPGDGESYDDLDTGMYLYISGAGYLYMSEAEPDSSHSSVYFRVTDFCRLTGEAVKAIVCVA